MAWALVNLVDVKLQVQDEKGQHKMIAASPGTICNLISYDGSSPYTPVSEYKLEKVPDTTKVGDTGY